MDKWKWIALIVWLLVFGAITITGLIMKSSTSGVLEEDGIMAGVGLAILGSLHITAIRKSKTKDK